jgi:predicted glutamine amidotransferase
MCRLLAYASPTPRTVLDVLGKTQLDRFTQLATLHTDGWGAAWTDGDDVWTRREPVNAATSATFASLTRDQQAIGMSLHLRLASDGAEVIETNNHPFTRAGITAMPNGSISPRGRLDALLDTEVLDTLTSTTDTERYLALIVAAQATTATLTDAVSYAVRRLRSEFPTASLNAVIMTATQVFVVHAGAMAANPADELRARSGCTTLPDGHATCYYQMYSRTDDDGTLVFSSSGLDTDGWSPVPDESITSIDVASGAMATVLLADAA